MLVLGTANRRRAGIGDLLRPVGVELQTLANFADDFQVSEDGDTFAANARLKAAGYARHLGRWVLADDSGLQVDAWRPAGVFRPIFRATPRMSRTIVCCWSSWASFPGGRAHIHMPHRRGRSGGRNSGPERGRMSRANPFRAPRRKRLRLRSALRDCRIPPLVRRIGAEDQSLPEPSRPGRRPTHSATRAACRLRKYLK